MSQSTSTETILAQKLKNQIDMLSDRNIQLEIKMEQEQANKLVFE